MIKWDNSFYAHSRVFIPQWQIGSNNRAELWFNTLLPHTLLTHKTFPCSPWIISGDWHTAGIRIPFSVSVFSLAGSQDGESFWKRWQLDSSCSAPIRSVSDVHRTSIWVLKLQRIFFFYSGPARSHVLGNVLSSVRILFHVRFPSSKIINNHRGN